jgi:hypothetical protein
VWNCTSEGIHSIAKAVGNALGKHYRRSDEMAFAAYDGREKMIPWRGRDKDGILGIFEPGDGQPVATADTLDQLEREAWAYLGREPSASLILIDAENRIHERLINSSFR